ncbi:hypothetical protein QR680_008375 [Steinernema hermaphroditum]|uniref:Serpin domain-containing protein n=1 Tax=Steinernema hermaphroditum TaxID=289476 RepID=A0AA39IIS3_9BILA|nr:hypothetical protein QR680_008375 [Steinernema hermaphroditum]
MAANNCSESKIDASQLATVWDAPHLLDISLDIIRSAVSKKVNESIIPINELQTYRRTYEECNICVSPLEVLRGFGAVLLMAESQTYTDILHCLRKCLYGPKAAKQSAQEIHQQLFKLNHEYVCSLTSSAVRIFFEKRSVLPFDRDIVRVMNAFYMEPSPPGFEELKANETVLRQMNFQTSPSGYQTRLQINRAMKIATNGTVEHVVRRDLAPDWRARFVVASCMDGNFYWKVTGLSEPRKTYFYDASDHLAEKRSTVKAVKAECAVRTTVWKSRRIMELDSYDKDVKLYIIQPLYTELTNHELSTMTGDVLREFIEVCSRLPQQSTTVMMPLMSMACPFGVRPAFDKAKGGFLSNLFSGKKGVKSTIPSIERAFSPYESDFNRVLAVEKGFGAAFVFALYEHYHKTKFNIMLSQRAPLNPDEVRSIISPPQAKTLPPEALDNIDNVRLPQRLKLVTIRDETKSSTLGSNVRPSEQVRQAAAAIESELAFAPIKKKSEDAAMPENEEEGRVGSQLEATQSAMSDVRQGSARTSAFTTFLKPKRTDSNPGTASTISSSRLTRRSDCTQRTLRGDVPASPGDSNSERQNAGEEGEGYNGENTNAPNGELQAEAAANAEQMNESKAPRSNTPTPNSASKARQSSSKQRAKSSNGRSYVTYRELRQGHRTGSNKLAREDRSVSLRYELDDACCDDSHMSTTSHGKEGHYVGMDAEINIDSSFLFVAVATNPINARRFPLYVGRFTNIDETYSGGFGFGRNLEEMEQAGEQ